MKKLALWRISLARFVSWVLPTLVLLAGCPRRVAKERAPQGPLAIGSVKITRQPEEMLQALGVTEATARGWVARWMAASAAVTAAEQPAARGYNLSLSLGLGEQRQLAGSSEPALLVEVRVEKAGALEAAELRASSLSQLARAELEQQAPALHGMIRKAVEQVLADVDFQAALVVGSEERLVQALTQTKDIERLAAAIEIAAVRRAPAAFAALVQQLKHPQFEISDRAVGALVALGDRRAVPHLTRLSKFSDTARLAKLLDGIGSLGGQEAQAYLELVASGHEDPDIRDLAQEALDRLKRAEDTRSRR